MGWLDVAQNVVDAYRGGRTGRGRSVGQSHAHSRRDESDAKTRCGRDGRADSADGGEYDCSGQRQLGNAHVAETRVNSPLFAQLELFPLEVIDLPWGGVSPRVLTRAHKRFIFNREGKNLRDFFADPDQLVLRLTREKRRRRPSSQGAATLLPLPLWRRNG